MNPAHQSRAASWLPVMIRLTAAGYLLFFVPNLILATTHQVNTLFNWGQGGPDDQAVSVMLSTFYAVWALFLFRSAGARTPPTSASCSSWPSPSPTSTIT